MTYKYRRVLGEVLDSIVYENRQLRTDLAKALAKNERLRGALTEAREEIYRHFSRPYTLPVNFERYPLIQRIDAALTTKE